MILLTDYETLYRRNQETIRQLEESYYSDDDDYGSDYGDDDYPYDTTEEAYD